MPDDDLVTVSRSWLDKLEIREVIERSMRYVDDENGDRYAELFTVDAVLQLASTVFAGRAEIRAMFDGRTRLPDWREPGGLLLHPGGAHCGSNPIIDVDGDDATAETDMIVLTRDDDGRAKITLVARYRDRFQRVDGRWLIACRTGVSIARPGQAGTDTEWARALDRMPAERRARFRLE